MSQFYKPRLSSAIVCALFCINYSFASPLVIDPNPRPRPSIIAAYEPVSIIPPDDLPKDWIAPEGGPGITTFADGGATQLTTYNNRRDLTQGGKEGSASEPVNIIPTDRYPELQSSSSIINATNDGATLTTNFNTSSRRKTTETNSLDLVNTANSTASDPGVNEVDMGLNCQGSALMCIGAPEYGVMHTLRDYMYAIPHGYRYYAGQNIACMAHHAYPTPWISWGFYCAFMQGNVSEQGEDGAAIQLKMQQMIEHHCLGCGSVPFSPDNDPMKLGILTVNYVRHSECEGLCYYVPPGQSASSVKVPQGMHLVQ